MMPELLVKLTIDVPALNTPEENVQFRIEVKLDALALRVPPVKTRSFPNTKLLLVSTCLLVELEGIPTEMYFGMSK